MLSENLKALEAKLSDYRHCGAQISPEGVVAICMVLQQAQADAQALEQSALPLPRQQRAMPVGSFLLIDGGRS